MLAADIEQNKLVIKWVEKVKNVKKVKRKENIVSKLLWTLIYRNQQKTNMMQK